MEAEGAFFNLGSRSALEVEAHTLGWSGVQQIPPACATSFLVQMLVAGERRGALLRVRFFGVGGWLDGLGSLWSVANFVWMLLMYLKNVNTIYCQPLGSR